MADTAAVVTAGRRILCVDDDSRIRRALTNSLKALELVVEQAGTPEEAIAKATEHPDIAFVLMDFVLEGITGLELIAKLKPHLPNASFGLLTGVSDVNVMIEAVNTRAVQYFILKPWHDEELRDILRSGIGAASLAPKAAAVNEAPVAAPRGNRWVALLAIVTLVVASVGSWWLAKQQTREEAQALASVIADAALMVPLAAVSQLARDGVTYVAVWGADGELTAWSIDRNGLQVIGDDRDAVLALADVKTTEIAAVERSSSDRKVQAGVRLSRFEAVSRLLLWIAGVACLVAAVVATDLMMRRRS